MPLTGKYLKYSPEITLEIFTLVWDKLISRGWKPYSNQEIQNVWKYLTKNSWYGIRANVGRKFIQYKNDLLVGLTETTVQEILGYDPFVKEEVVPEYVECIDVATCNTKVGEIFKCRQIDNSFEWEYNNKTIKDYSSWDGWSVPWSDKLPQKHFKPSTKEAFDAQNKLIKKWSVGSYFVIEKDRLYNIRSSKCGDICIIKEGETFNFINKKDQTNWIFDFREGSRWFATKAEAEEFAKTLVGSVKEEVKQAVHCKTQEEWNFANDIHQSSLKADFKDYKDKTVLRLDFKNAYSDILWAEVNGYQILSFQEWCDLNGYKMGNEVKFEVGKWYKSNCFEVEYYLKYDKTIREVDYNKIFYSILIKDGEVKENDYIAYTALEKSFNLLTDLSEIQQYLPDDHPNKITPVIKQIRDMQSKFRVGDLVWISSRPITGNGLKLDGSEDGIYELIDLNSSEFATGHLTENAHFKFKCGKNYYKTNIANIRHAAPEEINNHLISIGQIPVGEPLNIGIEPNKDGAFKYTTYSGTTHVGKTSTISGPLKMTLSIDDEELPMVSIIKTNTIKQLLNND